LIPGGAGGGLLVTALLLLDVFGLSIFFSAFRFSIRFCSDLLLSLFEGSTAMGSDISG
jgi:hypothetical protein